jgi:ABC-2 type transport system ATP-binding protein
VRVYGLDPFREQRALGSRVGVLFAEDGLYQHRSVHENLSFFASLHGLNRERIQQVLEISGLADQSSQAVDKLSSSLKRRLAFGRAILHNPQALLLEEPFARCDQASIDLLKRAIRQLAQAGAAILILNSDQASLEDVCDRIYRLERGSLDAVDLLANSSDSLPPFKIPVRLEGKVALINPADILFADASEGRAVLQTAAERLPTQFTLGELETRLARRGFFRAHRSYLVNLQHVKEVIPYTRDSFSLRLDDPAETKIPLSKQAAAELKELLGF